NGSMNPNSRHVVVIGGGIIGLACAHYLERAGWRVTVLDRGNIGQGCSHANCGLICPSHVLPLAEPGAVWQGLRALLPRDAPFRIAPRLDPALWAWLWRFARRCNHEDMLQAGRALKPLLDSSLALYHELMSTERLACEWQTQGLLFVCRSREGMES